MEIRRIAVIGAGLMGHGIAQELACAGFDVRLNDLEEQILERALTNIRRNLGTLVAAGRFAPVEAETALASIAVTTSLDEAVRDADLVIEAVAENLELKQRLFQALDERCRADTILASNTSSYVPSALATATSRPERVLVTHYFNPPYLVPLVEIVPTPKTDPQVVDNVYALFAGMGKRPVIVRKEAVGFIANRMQIALLREALHIVEQGIAAFEDVDTVVRNSFGRRLPVAGPFEIADLAGLDIYAAAAQAILPDLAAEATRSPLLEERIARGDFGIKTGRGFRDWTPKEAEHLRRRMAEELLQRPPS
ncbi:MAG: 3-hydroxybutyryl-CoA dehydrogenase [Chloroflexi bacterium]|nr:MAG: 3-hydroxybutyryl-CoA dehydrogenase [Chloroflexota bacterium]